MKLEQKCIYCLIRQRASLVAETVKNGPVMQETKAKSLGQEDILEEEMATHSSIFAWRIPGTEEPVGLQSGVWVGFTKSWAWLNS